MQPVVSSLLLCRCKVQDLQSFLYLLSPISADYIRAGSSELLIGSVNKCGSAIIGLCAALRDLGAVSLVIGVVSSDPVHTFVVFRRCPALLQTFIE